MFVNADDEEIRFPCQRQFEVWVMVLYASIFLYSAVRLVLGHHSPLQIIGFGVMVLFAIAAWLYAKQSLRLPLVVLSESAGFGLDRPRPVAFRYADVAAFVEHPGQIDICAGDPATSFRFELRRHWFSATDWDHLVPLLKARILAANPDVTIRTPNC